MAANDKDGTTAGVQYFDSDFSFDEHAAACAVHWDRNAGSDGAAAATADDAAAAALLPGSQSQFWDVFHSQHAAGHFYKPRRYLLKSFPCIVRYFATDTDNDQTSSDGVARILLEIGCGSGSSCLPILQHCAHATTGADGRRRHIVLACDSSSVAVETTRHFVDQALARDCDAAAAGPRSVTFRAFVADPARLGGEETAVNFPQAVKVAYEDVLSSLAMEGSDMTADDTQDRGIAGIVLMVFVLSAVTPSRVARFLTQVYETTKPGGKVCFRDYGLYDMPMLRFPATARTSAPAEDPAFVRGEGTIARFFSVETTAELFAAAGFAPVELRYCTVFNHNRKTGQKLKRVFVHGVFEKPI